MKEFQERRRIKKFLHSRYAIAVLLVVIALLGQAIWGIYAKYERSKEIADRARADLDSLKERETALKDSLEAINTDEGKERELRDRFGVVKEGERMIILVEEPAENTPAVVPEKSMWSRFLDLFR